MNKLMAHWNTLGIAFKEKFHLPADPEITLLKSLSFLQEERKFLSLILTWLNEYGHLVHVERIKSLARDLSPQEMAWLGGIASTMARRDRRWLSIERMVNQSIKIPRKGFPTSKLDVLVAKKNGRDIHFDKFGLVIPKLTPAKSTKLFSRKKVIRNHPWLRLRALFGANWRADIVWKMLQDAQQTPYQVAKKLGCTTETAYRNWYALEEADALGWLKL